MQIFKSLGIGFSLLLVPVCASAADGEQRAGLQMVSTDALPAPTLADLQASDRPYRVGPLVGTVEVAGKTPGEVSAALQDLFRGRFIKNPQVSVNLKEIVSQTVTIGGEVKKPGVYPIVGKMTLMTAIASAEGWTDISSRGAVAVFRTVGGKDYAALYNVKAIQKGTYPDPEIYASDVVMVGDSQGRKIWKDFLGASPLLAPFIYVLTNKN